MTVDKLLENENFSPICICDKSREIDGAYCGDLLSWVMGRAKENNAFVTIMTNINVLAVASLIDFSAVIICEDAELSQEFIETAKTKDINIVKSKLPSFETCALLSRII